MALSPILYYTARSENTKTGNIPTQWIGKDSEESKSTCCGCPLLAKICYSHNGTPGYLGFPTIQRRASSGKDYSLWNALLKRSDKAKFVRFGSIGDPAAIHPATYTKHMNTIRKIGLGVLSYTHFWRTRGAHLRGEALASCDTMAEAAEAVNAGWRATVHVHSMDKPQGKTADGHKYTVCPAQRGLKTLGKKQNKRDNPHYDARYKGITCNDCGLCDPERKGLDIVVFLNH